MTAARATARTTTRTGARTTGRTRTAARPRTEGGGDGDGRGDIAPVVVLTYAHAGAVRLRDLLSEHAGLACTTGTGLLPLCGQALATWRQVEGGRVSSLATASVRTLATGMITSMCVRIGRRRWCEIAVAQTDNAEAFARVFPRARFVCLHRRCPDMAYAALRATPWGLSGPAFAPYVAAHPGSTVAALGAYWAAHAGPLLDFERAHADACLRVGYERLVADPASVTDELADFLGLRGKVPFPRLAEDQDTVVTGADAPGSGAELPVGQLPAVLRTEIDRLHAALGYPALGESVSGEPASGDAGSAASVRDDPASGEATRSGGD